MKWISVVSVFAVLASVVSLAQQAAAADQPNWMSKLSDHTLITSMSIPGTHDTFTYSWPGMPVGPVHNIIYGPATCQYNTIEEQLRAGIRFLDMRLKLKRTITGRRFRVTHNAYDTSFTADEAFDKIKLFLRDYPREAILIRLKMENDDQKEKNQQDFSEEFQKKYLSNSKYAGLFYVKGGTSGFFNLRLREVRGKIVLLFENLGDTYTPAGGINYGTTQIVKYDEFTINSSVAMDSKEKNVQRGIMEASSVKPKEKFVITYTSGSLSNGKGFFNRFWPYDIATGLYATNNRFIPGQNERTLKFLQDNQESFLMTGAIMMDFPGAALIETIISFNGRYPIEY